MQKYEYGDFERGFFSAALWSSNDESTPEGGEPFDANYEIEDIAWESFAKLISDCATFRASQAYQDVIEAEEPRKRMSGEYSIEELAGHDFWLTRCGHGAGLWDGDWQEPHATALDQLSKVAGEVDLYLGDDGKIYAC